MFYISCSYFLGNEYWLLWKILGHVVFGLAKELFSFKCGYTRIYLMLTILIRFVLVPSVLFEYIDLSFVLGKFS